MFVIINVRSIVVNSSNELFEAKSQEAYTLVVQHLKCKQQQHNELVESKGILLNLTSKFICNLIFKKMLNQKAFC